VASIAFLAQCIGPMRSTSSDEYPRCPSTLQRCREQRANYVVRASVSLFELTATAAACWAGGEDVTALGFPVAVAISRIGRLLHAVRRMRSKRAGRHFTKSGPTQAQPRQLVTPGITSGPTSPVPSRTRTARCGTPWLCRSRTMRGSATR
jgi:hypothetical protein